MAIEKHVQVDQIEVVSNGVVQVRTAINIIEDGVIISQHFHRHVVSPGSDYNDEDERVKAICSAVHTPKVIKTYKDAIAARGE